LGKTSENGVEDTVPSSGKAGRWCEVKVGPAILKFLDGEG